MKLLGEWWVQVWPNLASSGVTFGAGLLWAKRRILQEMERRELNHLLRHQETQQQLRAIKKQVEGENKA